MGVIHRREQRADRQDGVHGPHLFTAFSTEQLLASRSLARRELSFEPLRHTVDAAVDGTRRSDGIHLQYWNRFDFAVDYDMRCRNVAAICNPIVVRRAGTHLQRIENAFSDEVFPRLSGDCRNDLARYHVEQVVVVEFAAESRYGLEIA